MGKMDIQKKKRIAAIACAAVFLVFAGAVCWLVGKPMIEFVSEPEKFRAWVDQSGIWGRLAFVGMMAFQIVLAFIPGEPLEIGAGYAFGCPMATCLLLLGIALGSAAIFFIVRRLGMKVVDLFVPRQKLDELAFINSEKRRTLFVFFSFLIPGSPKRTISYFMGMTTMPAWTFILVSTLARLPAVVVSTYGGEALGDQRYILALLVFAGMLLAGGVGALVYRRVWKAKHRSKD